MEIIEAIDQKIGQVRTESLDLSIGELAALHENRELVIQPDFQRLFRWSFGQRSRLVESLLLELPIPSIFVIEKEDGVLELIDGLQRISSLVQFINPDSLGLKALVLEGCDLVPELNGNSFEDLPITLRLRIKRTGIRTVIIKRQSSQFLRYEMFKRLNTGGAKLSEQDIRNVNARMLGEKGAEFYEFLVSCAAISDYKTTASDLLPAVAIDARTDEELVLRFFAVKNFRQEFKGSISEWLDNYMEAMLLGDKKFNFKKELAEFKEIFSCLATQFGPNAFVKHRNGSPIGGLAPAYYEAVTMGCYRSLDGLMQYSPQDAQAILAKTVQSDAFREVTGPGANSLPKMERRIQIIAEAFNDVL